MPGTPPSSPRFSAPRYADGDTAAFAAQVNAVTDVFDAKGTVYATGTHAARLAATATDGLLWRETDTNSFAIGTGSAWTPIGWDLVTISGNYTASNRQFVNAVASGPITVTIPSPTKNFSVGVFASNLVSSTNTVTVTTPSGLIIGGGQTGNASLPLNALGATVTLLADGANWIVIAGQRAP